MIKLIFALGLLAVTFWMVAQASVLTPQLMAPRKAEVVAERPAWLDLTGRS